MRSQLLGVFGALGLATIAIGCREDTESPTAATPEHVTAAITTALTFRLVSVGAGHGCGLTTDGVAYCWGLDAVENGYSLTPVQVAGDLRFRQVSTGYYYQCGVALDDRVYCWDGSHTPTLVPEPM